MGLQSWTPSTPALSTMACLDVETPSICRGKFKSVLQLCLQQRRTREQLAEQGIMPPLKAPATFHERIRSLERARTGSFLKHKLCSRPERSELVRMHILQETQAEPSLHATQMKLKRARLADSLNEKLSQRPGPMQLLRNNILPVDPSAEDPPDDKAKPEDVYSFTEDSGEAPSPPAASPREPGEGDAASAPRKTSPPAQRSPSPSSQPTPEDAGPAPVEQTGSRKSPAAPPPVAPGGALLVKQSLSKLSSEKSRSKRTKEPKPRVKKLKYHQYIPPDRKQELSEVQMDSAYARLLQQQQQFLQLQILSQQHFNFQPSQAANTNRPTAEAQASCSSIVLAGAAPPSHAQPQQGQINCKPDHLPANLDEMKVAELKMELKLRSLPVSGTKTDLIERLRLYQSSSLHADKTPEAPQPDNAKLSPPVSPIASRVSSLGIEDPDTAAAAAAVAAHAVGPAPEESPADKRPPEKDSEKDKRLHEKERQIEELMRKLEQEQRLVEELKMQLEVEKRSLHGDSPPLSSPLQVKEENTAPPSCTGACGSPAPPPVIKQEPGLKGQRTAEREEAEQAAEGGALVLLAAPFSPAAAAVAIQLPANSVVLQAPDNGGVLGLRQAKAGASPQPNAWRAESATPAFLNTFPAGAPPCQAERKDPPNVSPPSSRTAFTQPLKFPNPASKIKDPPCYEDAVKQTRTLQSAVQGHTSSQHMDDLFDVLIESGEISPFVRQDAACQQTPLPVTASVTTLPISTVLSRPPPQVQVAQLRSPSLGDRPGLPSQPLLGGTVTGSDSPAVTMEMDFNDSASSLNLHGASMESMDWLDLNLSAAGVSSLDMSAPVGVFTDFLDSHELQLNWD